jgi:hypothetical protein
MKSKAFFSEEKKQKTFIALSRFSPAAYAKADDDMSDSRLGFILYQNAAKNQVQQRVGIGTA